jgi:N-acyl-D-aspartate/D-glutamate deacylase
VAYDLIVRGGTIVDGSGLPGYRADLGIADGVIAAIGDLKSERAKETIDAEGHVVAPGFVDGHTHMDAQVFWDPLGSNSCWHGVTSVVMGNCGFSLAPCAEKNKALVLHNLERAEDIPRPAMEAGIPWSWETFPEYLDAVDALPKGINYAGYVGHSALRTHVMGERAMEEAASPDDLAAMTAALAEGLGAGAIGFSTSRTKAHRTPDGRPVASRMAAWSEVEALAGVMKGLGAGVMEIARENAIPDPDARRAEFDEIRALALGTRVPLTFGSFWYRREVPDIWREQFALVDEIVAAGGRVLIQGTTFANFSLRSFETLMPYDRAPVWREFRKLPLAEQEAGLRNPEMRAKLVDAVRKFEFRANPAEPNALQRPANWDWIYPYDRTLPPYPSVGDIARARGQEPIETVIDLALEKHLKLFFINPSNSDNDEFLRALVCHPHAAVTFSDAGAHVATTLSPMHCQLLGYWVRDRQVMSVEQAVRKITYDIASFWGLDRRGLLREGYHADVVVFDPATIAPEMPELIHDLPTGAPRIKQKAVGIKATIVNGQVFIRDNAHTGVLAGRLLRGPLARN